MREAIDEQIDGFFWTHCIGAPNKRHKCTYDTDYGNSSLFIDAPYLQVTLDYVAGEIFIHRNGYENKRYNDDKFVLFGDFDTKRKCYNPYNEICDGYEGSIKQMYDYIKYAYVPAILEPIFDIYTKATKKTVNEIIDFDKALGSNCKEEAV